MKIKNSLSFVAFIALLLPIGASAQSNWSENDDMYFSKKDRQKIYASVDNIELEQSEYTANHNFGSSTIQSTTAGSPTVQSNLDPEADNNQYFITDYSLKNKADNTVKTYSGINTNTGFKSGINIILSFGSTFGSPYGRYGYYNPYTDPFSPYYDPFYRYSSSNYYSSLGYNPWRYNNNYRYSNDYNNALHYSYYGYYAACLPNTYVNHVRNAERYRNSRKVISGTRSQGSTVRVNSRNATVSKRPIKTTGSNINPNGRNSSRTSYRKYPNSVQNRIANEASSKPKRVTTYNRTNSNWNNTTNFTRPNNNRSSRPSSSSPSYNRPRNRSTPSSGGSGSRSSSGSSRGGKRKY